MKRSVWVARNGVPAEGRVDCEIDSKPNYYAVSFPDRARPWLFRKAELFDTEAQALAACEMKETVVQAVPDNVKKRKKKVVRK